MKYQIIYADPPWPYNARRNPNTLYGTGAWGKYPLMSFKEIAALPVAKVCQENCALFLWATFPFLPRAISTMQSWGFTYKTVGFVWIKFTKGGKPFFGTGYYAKSNAEICLLGIRGRMKPITNKVSQIIATPRLPHSSKPPEARDKIVQLFGDVPRVELFARETVPSWDAWGLEIPRDQMAADKRKSWN